jgi:hypothetical protein
MQSTLGTFPFLVEEKDFIFFLISKSFSPDPSCIPRAENANSKNECFASNLLIQVEQKIAYLNGGNSFLFS